MKKFLFLLSTLLIISCSSDVGENSKISECGGFKASGIKKICSSKIKKVESKIKSLDEDGKCKDFLRYEYNSKEKILSLTHLNAYLNCCGEHSVSISSDGNNHFTMVEHDEPEDIFGSRCKCMCTYSFYTELHNINKGVIKINLKQDITDEDNNIRNLLTDAEIDLNKENGEVFIKEFFSMGSCNK